MLKKVQCSMCFSFTAPTTQGQQRVVGTVLVVVVAAKTAVISF